MLEARGNLWSHDAEIKVITTNGFVKANGACVMGRGCAREARDMFPGIDRRLGDLINQYGNRAFRLSKEHGIASMPVKHNWWEKADIELIVISAYQLVDMADKFGWQSIVIPRPGCGNGQLDWDDVKPRLEEVLDDRFTIITF